MAARKAAKQADRAARQAVRGEDVRFSGALSNKSKDDLIDIAHHLTIETTGTKADLLKAIQSRFEMDQHLKADPRFEGLFNNRLRATTKRPIEQTDPDLENIPPPSRRRIDIVPPMVLSIPNATGGGQTAITHTPFSTSSMAPFSTPAPFNLHNCVPSAHTFMPTTLSYPSPYYYPNPKSISSSSYHAPQIA